MALLAWCPAHKRMPSATARGCAPMGLSPPLSLLAALGVGAQKLLDPASFWSPVSVTLGGANSIAQPKVYLCV